MIDKNSNYFITLRENRPYFLHKRDNCVLNSGERKSKKTTVATACTRLKKNPLT